MGWTRGQMGFNRSDVCYNGRPTWESKTWMGRVTRYYLYDFSTESEAVDDRHAKDLVNM